MIVVQNGDRDKTKVRQAGVHRWHSEKIHIWTKKAPGRVLFCVFGVSGAESLLQGSLDRGCNVVNGTNAFHFAVNGIGLTAFGQLLVEGNQRSGL